MRQRATQLAFIDPPSCRTDSAVSKTQPAEASSAAPQQSASADVISASQVWTCKRSLVSMIGGRSSNQLQILSLSAHHLVWLG